MAARRMLMFHNPNASAVMTLYMQFVKQAMPTSVPLLESALSSPINSKIYEGQTDIFVLAAKYASRIIMNHAYEDGNKRCALVVADSFLKMNGYQLQEEYTSGSMQNELVNAHIAIATSVWTEDQLSVYYRSIATQAGPLNSAIAAIYSDTEKHYCC